jgi:hypothetical protein
MWVGILVLGGLPSEALTTPALLSRRERREKDGESNG